MEKWKIFRTHNINFRISEDLNQTFEGSEIECKKWIEQNFKPIQFQVNELFKTVTFLAVK